MRQRCTVEDSLLLARQRFPGQRNSLDALCKLRQFAGQARGVFHRARRIVQAGINGVRACCKRARQYCNIRQCILKRTLVICIQQCIDVFAALVQD